MKNYGIYVALGVILLGLAGFILHNGCMSGANSNRWSLNCTQWIAACIDKKAIAKAMERRSALVGYAGNDMEQVLERLDCHGLVRKIGHLLEYACLGFLLGVICFFVRWTWYWKLAGLLLSLWPIPLLDEFLQSFVERTSCMADVYLDVLGELLGIMMAFALFGFVDAIFLRGARKQPQKKQNSDAPA